MKDRSTEMMYAWVRALEEAQPQYGPLLQSTVDRVGYPAIDEKGIVRTIGEKFAFWGAIGYMQGFAGSYTERRSDEIMGREYPALEAAGDEKGMVIAMKKGRFFESLSQWIKSNEPEGLPMETVPNWLKPFVDHSNPEL
jgi:hypothetical protein